MVSVDNIASNETELQELVDNDGTGDASPGAVIGIDNTIILSSDLKVNVPDVTILSENSMRQTIKTGQYAVDIENDGIAVKGLEIVGQNDDNSQTTDKGIRLQGSRSNVAIENNIIRGCWEPIILNSTTTSHKNITIANNDLSGEWIGIMAFTVDDSEIRNNYIHDIDVGIQMSAYGSGNQPENNVIKNNTFKNIADPDVNPDGTEMNYYDILLQAKNTTITYNELIGSGTPKREWGIIVTDSIYGSDLDISGTEIHYNNIYGHSKAGVAETEDYYADLSPSGYTVDAAYNWRGDPSGPGGVGGDKVSENVTYKPWLAMSATEPMWDNNVEVAEDGTLKAVSAEIQPGINAANANDTVSVKEGTYEEQVVIDVENLTLRGVGGPTLLAKKQVYEEAKIRVLQAREMHIMCRKGKMRSDFENERKMTKTVKAREHHGTDSLDLTIPTEVVRKNKINEGDIFEVKVCKKEGEIAIEYHRVYESEP